MIVFLELFLRELQKVFMAGSSRYRVNPLVLLAVSLVLSIVLLSCSLIVVSTIFSLLAVAVVVVRNATVLAKSLAYSVVFLTPYIASAMVVQYVAGLLDPLFVFTSCLRIVSLILLSVVTVSLVDTPSVIKAFTRLSPSIGLLLVIAFKSLHNASLNMLHVSEIYGVNLKRIHYIRRMVLALRASINLSLHTLLYTVESIYTHRHVILGVQHGSKY